MVRGLWRGITRLAAALITPSGCLLAAGVLAGPPALGGTSSDRVFANGFEPCDVSRDIVEDWPKYRRDLSNTGHSAERTINSCNVSRLETKWQVAPAGDQAPFPAISGSPAVATIAGIRTVYVGNWSGQLFARNAEDGSERWTFTIPASHRTATSCQVDGRCRIASSPAVADGMVFFGAENARLYAVDAATGTEAWSVPLGDPEQGYEIWSSPAAHDGVVYVGVASHGAAPCVAGEVVARNVADGSEAWTFDAIDQSTCESGQGDCLGAGVWSSPAIDAVTGTLYVGTGNAGEGCAPSTPHADLYPNGIVALSLGDGSVKDFFQTLAMDPRDAGDIGASPALHETRITDECSLTDITRRWVSVPSKDNIYWTAERDATGFATEFVGLELLFDPDLDTGEQLIASPGLIPVTEITACGEGQAVATMENDIFVPRRDGYVFALRQDGAGKVTLQSATEVTRCKPNACVMVSAPATIQDVIIFGGGEGNIYATTRDGRILWSAGANGLIAGSPAISHGVVFYAAYDGVIYAKSVDGE